MNRFCVSVCVFRVDSMRILAIFFWPDLCYLNSHKFNAVRHFWLIEIYAHFDIEIIMAMWQFGKGPTNRIKYP